jgi:hypothetical protein
MEAKRKGRNRHYCRIRGPNEKGQSLQALAQMKTKREKHIPGNPLTQGRAYV